MSARSYKYTNKSKDASPFRNMSLMNDSKDSLNDSDYIYEMLDFDINQPSPIKPIRKVQSQGNNRISNNKLAKSPSEIQKQKSSEDQENELKLSP